MRPAPAIIGVFILVAAWCGPLPALTRDSFFAHMVMHVAAVAVAAPLLVLAIAGTRADPTGRLPRLFNPFMASLLEFAVVWGWHLPQPRAAAAGSQTVLWLEQASFLAIGILLWLACLGGRPTIARAAAGAFGLFLTSMHMTLLGALLALAQRPLFGPTSGTAPDLARIVADQQVGGIAMLMVGGASYLVGGLYLTARLLFRAAPDADGPKRHASLG